jgi:hypothetical protein
MSHGARVDRIWCQACYSLYTASGCGTAAGSGVQREAEELGMRNHRNAQPLSPVLASPANSGARSILVRGCPI